MLAHWLEKSYQKFQTLILNSSRENNVSPKTLQMEIVTIEQLGFLKNRMSNDIFIMYFPVVSLRIFEIKKTNIFIWNYYSFFNMLLNKINIHKRVSRSYRKL